MKLFGFYLITLVLATNSFAQNSNEITDATDFKKLEQGLLSLKELMAQETVLHTEAIPLELDIRRQVDNIYLDINMRLPNEDGKLTPEWKEFTTQLAEVLEPHERTILESAYLPQVERNRKRSQLNRLTFNSDQLISFLKPDQEVELLMREKLQEYPTLRWQIYRHLHELRLLSETDVKEMEVLGATISDPKEKIKWAEEVSFYGSDAGMDTLEEIMSVPFDPSGSVNERGGPENNESFSSYIPAGRAIRFLGAKGERLLPLIKDREKEVFTEYSKLFGDEFATRAINLFKVMQMSINGEVNPYSSARNRSGLLYPPGQEPTDKATRQIDTKKPNDAVSLRPGKRHDAAPDEGSKTPFASGRFIYWLMSALALVIFVTAMILLYKRRNA
jgi:hypothetical protein